jgi:hypothetical protein
MKTQKILYILSTGLIACLLVYSSFLYLTDAVMKDAIAHLGFPPYFRIELALCQLVAFGVLIVPGLNVHLKITTYAGVFLTLVSAVVAHASVADPAITVITPVVCAIVLAMSFYFYLQMAGVLRSR